MSVGQNKITWGEITCPSGAGEVTLGHAHACAVPTLLLPTPDSGWPPAGTQLFLCPLMQLCAEVSLEADRDST